MFPNPSHRRPLAPSAADNGTTAQDQAAHIHNNATQPKRLNPPPTHNSRDFYHRTTDLDTMVATFAQSSTAEPDLIPARPEPDSCGGFRRTRWRD